MFSKCSFNFFEQCNFSRHMRAASSCGRSGGEGLTTRLDSISPTTAELALLLDGQGSWQENGQLGHSTGRTGSSFCVFFLCGTDGGRLFASARVRECTTFQGGAEGSQLFRAAVIRVTSRVRMPQEELVWS